MTQRLVVTPVDATVRGGIPWGMKGPEVCKSELVTSVTLRDLKQPSLEVRIMGLLGRAPLALGPPSSLLQ